MAGRCPLCHESRDFDESPKFFYCKSCKSVIHNLYEVVPYGREYFMDDYEKQYGKTYIDDYENIYANSLKRMDNIFRFFGRKDYSSLLDIGSAAGFFLKAAKDRDIDDLMGVEISQFAAEFCSQNFSIPVVRQSFDTVNLKRKFDIITAWFFIEHCADPRRVLEKIYKMLNDSGVLAFSVPSCHGPMYRFHREEWERTHPGDHLINLSPGGAKKILGDLGFKKVRVLPSGFHPERVLSNSSPLYGLFTKLYRLYGNMTGFSDTIEIYAVK